MFKKMTCYTLLFSLLFASFAFGATKIQNIEFKKKTHKGVLRVNFKGELAEYPEFYVVGDSIILKVKKAALVKTIDRYEAFSSKKRDTRLRAYYSRRNEIKVKAAFPFKMEKYKDLVALTIKDRYIELTFPHIKTAVKKKRKLVPVAKKAVAPSKKEVIASGKVTKELLNESYLKELERTSLAEQVVAKDPTLKADIVNTTLAAPAKKVTTQPKPTFSFAAVAGKFIAFLAIILLGFYGVVVLMKKGFIKRGKLGFLNNTNQVTVLSQTHIAPKKSLMLIKAHNQVFLVSNTDAGIHAISEINDVAGLLKDGEKIIAGDNFDDSLKGVSETKINLKKDITQSSEKSSLASLSSLAQTKDKVKFSDQLKKKVKNLKPLQ